MSIFFKNFGPYSKLQTANWPIAWRKQTQPYNKENYADKSRCYPSQQAASETCIILILILSWKICQTHVRVRADLRNNQPDVLEIVKNDTFFLQQILYNTFVLRLLGEVVRTFYPTIFFFGLVPTEWTKIETKHSWMHFQRLMYSKK